MPSGAPRHRVRHDDESSGQESHSDGDYESASSGLSRRRRGPRTSGRNINNDRNDVEARSRLNGPNGTARERNSDKFQAGAIVRISLENFLVYDQAEFLPGPYLNMVIGPNGTGKSSLVNAICLGLGFPPRLLARAGTTSEFVKHNKDAAIIETELKGLPSDHGNYIIRVQIRRDNNSQKWWLNGKETTHKKVQELVGRLKCQVDNLCQFLPQDRVVEFARLNDVELLEETLRAAAPEEVTNWHDNLKELHNDHKDLQKRIQASREELQSLQARQLTIQADVDRMEERDTIERQIRVLKAARIAAQYNEIAEKYEQGKARRTAASATLRRLEEENDPSLQAVKAKQEYLGRVEAGLQKRKRKVQAAEQRANELRGDVEAATRNVSRLATQAEAQAGDIQKKKVAARECRNVVKKYESQLRMEPPKFDPGVWNQKIRSIEHKVRDLNAQKTEIDASIQDVRTQGISKRREREKLRADLEALHTKQGQQLSLLRKLSPHAAEGWEWLQENMDQFRKEVFGPAILTCSVKDERYADHIEALLTAQDVSCFTTQCREDHQKLSDIFYGKLKLSVAIRTCFAPLESFKSPMDTESASQVGLDGFAIDFLDGPPPILAMLCSERRLHSSGVSLRDINDAQYSRLEAIEAIPGFVVGGKLFRVTRRKEYGAAGKSTSARDIRRAQFWTSQQVDASEASVINERLREVEREFNELKDQAKELESGKRTRSDEVDELESQIAELRKEKSVLQKEYTIWKGIPLKIETEQRNLERAKSAFQKAIKEYNSLFGEREIAVVDRANAVLAHHHQTVAVWKAHQALAEGEVCLIEAKSDIKGLEERSQGIIQRIREAQETLRFLETEIKELKARGRQVGQQIAELRNDFPDIDFTDLAVGKSEEEIQNEIDAEESKLELIQVTPANVLQRYNQQAQQIRKIEQQLENGRTRVENLDGQITELQGRWLPRLEALVTKVNDAFSYNFEQIGCAGEVRLHKDDDFDQWALHIMVSYRPNEPPVKLTASRQSGGERSVATIFYLMSLQADAQVPFRVVDEINQGMDPRNERMMHDRMVEIACREHNCQYFLVTPKLLTGLRYDEKMTVLCIASGAHMPKEPKKLDFARVLAKQKAVLQRA